MYVNADIEIRSYMNGRKRKKEVGIPPGRHCAQELFDEEAEKG